MFSVNGSPKKGKSGKNSDSFNSSDNSDDDDIPLRGVVRNTGRRAVTKPIRYAESSGSGSAVEMSDVEPELYDNSAIKEEKIVQAPIELSDSEDEPPPKKNESSEDLFDSLIGKFSLKYMRFYLFLCWLKRISYISFDSEIIS